LSSYCDLAKCAVVGREGGYMNSYNTTSFKGNVFQEKGTILWKAKILR